MLETNKDSEFFRKNKEGVFLVNYCTNCGSEIEKNSNFCTYCGTKLNFDYVESRDQSIISEKEKEEARNTLKKLTGRFSNYKNKLSQEGLHDGEGKLIKHVIKQEIESGSLRAEDVERRLNFLIENKKKSTRNRIKDFVIFKITNPLPNEKLKKILAKNGVYETYENEVTASIYNTLTFNGIQIVTDEEFEAMLDKIIISEMCKITNPSFVLTNIVEEGTYFKPHNLSEYEIYEIKFCILDEIKSEEDIDLQERINYYIDLKTNKSKKCLTEKTGYGNYIFTESDIHLRVPNEENTIEVWEKNKNNYYNFLERLNNQGLTEDSLTEIGETIVKEIDEMNLKENSIDSRINYHINKLTEDLTPENVFFALTGFKDDDGSLNKKFLEKNKEKLHSEEECIKICEIISKEIKANELKIENISKRLNECIEENSKRNWDEFYKKAINGIKCEIRLETGETKDVVYDTKVKKGHKVNGLGAAVAGGFLLGPVGAIMGATTASAVNSNVKEDEIIEYKTPIPVYNYINTMLRCDKEKISFENSEIYYTEMSDLFLHEYGDLEKSLKIDYRNFHYTISLYDKFEESVKIRLCNARETSEHERFITAYGLYNLLKNKGKDLPENLIKEKEKNENISEVPSTTNADELMKYAELYKQGFLTEEEFNAMKKKLLGL